MVALFTPYQLGHLSLANRIVVPPMCQYSAHHGAATPWHMSHWSQLALSGAGLVIIEATGVSPEARISDKCLGLWDDATQYAFAQAYVAAKYTSPTTPFIIQLGHAGRKASSSAPWVTPRYLSREQGGWDTYAPSAQAFDPDSPVPCALDAEGIKRVIADFTAAAKRAQTIGLDGIELHAAHGYLLHQFLSPLSNQRTDQYGGSLDNRIRLVLEVFEAVKHAVPDLVVGVRISATDWVVGQDSWDLEQSIYLVEQLKKRGLDFVHVSTGGLSPLQKIHPEPGYQVSFAHTIKQQTHVPTIAVGMLEQAQLANRAIQEQQADMVGVARGILYDPRWPWHAAAELGATIDAAPQYWRCAPAHNSALFKR